MHVDEQSANVVARRAMTRKITMDILPRCPTFRHHESIRAPATKPMRVDAPTKPLVSTAQNPRSVELEALSGVKQKTDLDRVTFVESECR